MTVSPIMHDKKNKASSLVLGLNINGGKPKEIVLVKADDVAQRLVFCKPDDKLYRDAV